MLTKHRNHGCVLWAYLLLIITAGAHADGAAFTGQSQRHAASDPPTWATSDWTGGRPRLSTFAEIDKLALTDGLSEDVLRQYLSTATERPKDLDAQATCAYAIYKAQLNGDDASKYVQAYLLIQGRGPDHTTLPYTHAMFLLLAYNDSQSAWLASLGQRLLAHDGNDCDVMYCVIYLSDPSSSKEVKDHLLNMADHMLKLEPAAPLPYIARYGIYYPCFMGDLDADDAKQCISSLQAYVSHTPSVAGIAWAKKMMTDIAELRDEYSGKPTGAK